MLHPVVFPLHLQFKLCFVNCELMQLWVCRDSCVYVVTLQNCADHTTGDQCDICESGYSGDATQGTRSDCRPSGPLPQCRCDSRGSIRPDCPDGNQCICKVCTVELHTDAVIMYAKRANCYGKILCIVSLMTLGSYIAVHLHSNYIMLPWQNAK